MTIYLWVASAGVLLLFLVWSFLGHTDWARGVRLAIDFILIILMCAVFGITSYLQFRSEPVSGETMDVTVSGNDLQQETEIPITDNIVSFE